MLIAFANPYKTLKTAFHSNLPKTGSGFDSGFRMGKRRFSAGEADEPLTDEMRCRRSDGRKWRCRRRVMPGVTFCEHHYSSIKNRSELRNHDRSSDRKRKIVMAADSEGVRSGEPFRSADEDPAAGELMRMAIKRQLEKREKRIEKEKEAEKRMELPNGVMAISSTPVRVSGNEREIVDRKIGLGLSDGCTFRRCIRSKNVEPMPIGPVKKLPRVLGSSRRRICQGCNETSCKTCMQKGNLDSESKMLPALQLNWEQMSELKIEAKKQGRKLSGVEFQVAVCGHDEQLKCNYCGTSTGNFHRSCSECSYKLCLSCCQKIRGGSLSSEANKVSCKYISGGTASKHAGKTPNGLKKNVSKLHSSVVAEQRDEKGDDNIFCPTSEHGGCSDGILNMKFLLQPDQLQKPDT